tara:strand:+ start:201 stop:368 length:168 start_codon:yes stop_codon:yes gene_type:complete
MKPKHIGIDTTLTAKKMSIDTPLGTIESDSGNHLLDVASILVVILAFFVFKKLIK